jgi:hypothetical protein
MATFHEQLVSAFNRYMDEVDSEPTSLDDPVDWALDQGIIHPTPRDFRKALKEAMADALRQERRFDGKRWYRAKHSVRTSVGGVQLSLWADIDKNASQGFMTKSTGQRRRGVTNDCFQLKMDVDHYNEANPAQQPIPLVLDFTEDVAELEAASRKDEDGEAA